MKVKFKRTLAIASMLALASSVPVMAAGYSNSYGSAKLEVTYAYGLRNVLATTKRADTRYSSRISVTTVYLDGSEDTYTSRIEREDVEYKHSWEEAESYTSNHKVLYSGTVLLDMSFVED